MQGARPMRKAALGDKVWRATAAFDTEANHREIAPIQMRSIENRRRTVKARPCWQLIPVTQ
jgi:hypothetical protein